MLVIQTCQDLSLQDLADKIFNNKQKQSFVYFVAFGARIVPLIFLSVGQC